MNKKRPVCEDLLPEISVKLIDFPLDHALVIKCRAPSNFINLTQPSFVHVETNFLSSTLPVMYAWLLGNHMTK